MRRYVIGTLGAAVAGFGGSATAQDGRPAARIGNVQAVVPAVAYGPVDTVYRGQAPSGGTPAQGAGQTPTFGTPMPIPQNNSATSTTLPGSFGATGPGSTYTGPLPVLFNNAGPDMPGTVVPPMGYDGGASMGGGPLWWVTGEALLWWTKGAEFPPLLTTSSPQFNGVFGTGDTQILLGGQQLNPFQPGFRVDIGRWIGCNHDLALDASFFYLPKRTETFNADSNQYPVLARPFFNLNQNIPYVQLIASPGLSTGAFQARTESTLWGGDVNLRKYLDGGPCSRLDLIGGFRYLSLDEGLDITEAFARTPNSNTQIGSPDALSGIAVDSFHTQNKFYGGQLGFDWEVRRGRWFTDMKAKVAIGEMYSTVNVNGAQQINLVNGGTRTAVGGLLALPGNIGTYNESKFAWVPELGLNLGYHITPRLRATIGYNFLYVSHVLRPGDQIDPGIDVTRIPNFPVPGVTPVAARPAPTFTGSDYWAQGISLGLQFTW
ncbi:MAG TPA: BBP7 family outer membrane beta-barrel protein [Fimbriiglobus sp.]|jgi:hypothetical protein